MRVWANRVGLPTDHPCCLGAVAGILMDQGQSLCYSLGWGAWSQVHNDLQVFIILVMVANM